MTVNLDGPATLVARLGTNSFFPAWRTEHGLIVDLRMFGPDGKTLGWHPEKVPRDAPTTMVEAAAASEPQGFALVAGDGT